MNDDYRTLLVWTRPPAGGGLTKTVYHSASAHASGPFMVLTIDPSAAGDVEETQIPISLIVKIVKLKAGVVRDVDDAAERRERPKQKFSAPPPFEPYF